MLQAGEKAEGKGIALALLDEFSGGVGLLQTLPGTMMAFQMDPARKCVVLEQSTATMLMHSLQSAGEWQHAMQLLQNKVTGSALSLASICVSLKYREQKFSGPTIFLPAAISPEVTEKLAVQPS